MSEEALRRLLRVEEAILAKRNGAPTDADEATLQAMRDFAKDISDRAEAMWLQIEQAKAPNRTYDEALEAYVDACEEIGLDRDEAIAMAEGRIAIAERLIPEARPFAFSGDVIAVPEMLRPMFGSAAAAVVPEPKSDPPVVAKPTRQRRTRAAAETSSDPVEATQLEMPSVKHEDTRIAPADATGQEGLRLDHPTADLTDGDPSQASGGDGEAAIPETNLSDGPGADVADGDGSAAATEAAERTIIEGARESGADVPAGDAVQTGQPEASLFDASPEDRPVSDTTGDAVPPQDGKPAVVDADPAEADDSPTDDTLEPSNQEGPVQEVGVSDAPAGEDATASVPVAEAPATEASSGRRRLAFQRG